MLLDELYHHGIPKEVIQILKEQGLSKLYPPQEEAVKKGLLELKNSFVISVPTASGKTLIAELLMLRSLIERGGRCLYIVPLRALASEKLAEFKKYEKLGIKVGISTGDYDSSDSWLANYDVIVTTSEKADSLLRHKSEWLRSVKVLVVDEVHLINDGERGPTLEVTIAKLRLLNPEMLVLALSATIKNAEEIAEWLNAKLIKSEWRPVTLREGVYFEGEIFFSDSKSQKVESIVSDSEALNLAIETVKNHGQGLIFAGTRAGAEKFAIDAALQTKKFLSKGETDILQKLAKEALEVLPEPTKICRRLSRCIASGSAFHHAGLAAEQRRIVEEAFKANQIKVLSATPTLAAGVNLPARRVIVRDYMRYEAELGRAELPVLEIKQMFGRAGRPKYDDYGEALLIARSFNERSFLLDSYILAEPEKIYSKLAVESALRTHVLATIAMGYASSFDSLMEFFSKTFFAHQQEAYMLEGHLTKVKNFLVREKFCEEKRSLLAATLLGLRVAQLYIDPLSAVMLREALLRAEKQKVNEISYLHAISRTPELGALYMRRKDEEFCGAAVEENKEYFLFDVPEPTTEYWEYEEFLSEVKTALFLKDWIEERSEEFILEKYNLAPGDVRGKVELAEWLLYSMLEIGKLLRCKKLGEVARLRERVRHGIREELLELVSLKGIGRARARRLYARGFKSLKDLKKADVTAIAKVELIGKKLAQSIKEQLDEEIKVAAAPEKEGRKIAGSNKERQSRLMDFS